MSKCQCDNAEMRQCNDEYPIITFTNLIQVADNLKNSKKQIPNSNSNVFFMIFHWNLVLRIWNLLKFAIIRNLS